MEEIKIDDNNKENPQQTYKKSSESNQTINTYISMMTEEETALWLKKLNLDEEILTQIQKIIKNGKDLISIYENNKILEKLNIDLHSINIINNAIEEGLEEQLKINILIQKEKNIILNVENEPKFKLKEILIYLEKLLKKTVYLTPLNSSNELLTPNTLIVKKILLNPKKYCNLQLFDDKIISNNNINTNITSIPDSNTKNIPYTKLDNININTYKKEIQVISDNQNLNNQKIQNIGKGYVSLFQNNKNNLPDFTTDYKMSNQNRSNANNFIKLETKNPSKLMDDFKYHNLLSKKDNNKEEGDYLWRNLEMEETQLKVEVSDCIVDQLYNEVVEILEHIQLNRKFGELYHFKSIYACDEMPKLGFQQTTTTTENADNDENNNDNDNNILFNKA